MDIIKNITESPIFPIATFVIGILVRTYFYYKSRKTKVLKYIEMVGIPIKGYVVYMVCCALFIINGVYKMNRKLPNGLDIYESV